MTTAQSEDVTRLLVQFEAEPHGYWLAQLFNALTPENADLDITNNQVLAFFFLAAVMPIGSVVRQPNHKVGFAFTQRSETQLDLFAFISNDSSGKVQYLFQISAVNHPYQGSCRSPMVGQVKIPNQPSVTHSLTLHEQNLSDDYGEWLINIALPKINFFCLDASRIRPT